MADRLVEDPPPSTERYIVACALAKKANEEQEVAEVEVPVAKRVRCVCVRVRWHSFL